MTNTSNLFFDMWARHNDMLKIIVNDYDGKFTNKIWIFLMKKVGIKLKLNMTSHLQTNGQTKGQ
jgi:hypothetical protein